MKILTIRFKNLASLEGENEVDFTSEPLLSAGIFAITGPMGAGKSTLLDALCLALFAKTPRHLNARENGVELQDVGNSKILQGDIRGILRKGCSEGFAEVQFVAADGSIQKARWSVKRARNKTDGALQTDAMELKNLTTGLQFPETRKTKIQEEIERLIGLNFEQFTRSVLLAQGEFTAFLKADKDQKSSLLEKLTGTDIYSAISKMIFEKYKLAEQEHNNLQRQMEGIALVSQDELKLLTDQKAALLKTVRELEAELLKLADELNWHQAVTALTGYKEEAFTALQIFRGAKDTAKTRISTFNVVEAIQDSRAPFDARTKSMEKSKKIGAALSTLQDSIRSLNSKQLLIDQNLRSSKNKLESSETGYRQAAPVIAKAKVLDTLILEKNEQLASAVKEYSDAGEIQQKQDILIEEKEKEINLLIRHIEELDNWKQENEAKHAIAENLPIILSKLEDAGNLLAKEKQLIKDQAINTRNFLEAEKGIARFLKELEEKTIQLQELTALKDENESELSTITIDDIKEKERLYFSSINIIMPAINCWELLYTNQQEFEGLAIRLDSNSKSIRLQKATLLSSQASLQEALTRKEQTEKILNQALLQTQEKVQDMRARLTDGDPCPVCGSQHHPFATVNPQIDEVLDGLKTASRECTDQYNLLLQQCSNLVSECGRLETDRMALEAATATKAEKINELTLNWQLFEIDKTCLSLAPSERLGWLNTEAGRLKTALNTTRQQITNWQLLKDKTNQQNKAIATHEKLCHEIEDELKNRKRDAQVLTGEKKNLDEVLATCKLTITSIITQLDPYFADKEWNSKWQNSPAVFLQKAKQFAADWKNNIRLLQEETSRLQILHTELKGLTIQMESLTTAFNLAGEKLNGLQQSFASTSEERNQLFNGEPIQLVENNFNQQIETANNSVKEFAAEKDISTAALIKATADIEHQGKEQALCNQDIIAYSENIKSWIENYNTGSANKLNEEALIELLAYSPAWIVEERKALGLLDEAITTANATFNERALQLKNHVTKNPSLQLPNTLEARQTQVNELIETSRKHYTAIELKLLQDSRNKSLLGDMEAAIQLKKGIYNDWQKLNDLLGSADGKKFRQIAQEYTLDILLGFTNAHLQDLASRYKISRVPGSLALQVIDRDMGDEIRSVHSLSGGESFLVSLALALGLASLSSNKMKVESLFIDEGFGSLDPATLLIAMDALEKLQDMGRKVGVISHVQEMTERISTQVKISKLSNGRSKVDVMTI